MSYQNLDEAIQAIVNLKAENDRLQSENSMLQQNWANTAMNFTSLGWDDGQKLLPYPQAKTGFDLYYATTPLRSSNNSTKPLKGFSMSLDKIPNLTSRSDLKGFFLMFAKTPDFEPKNLLTNPNPTYKNEYTIMILGLDGDHNLLLDPTHRLPIVYEYMTPCPNTCPANLGTYF